jgi:hypothetical protein
MAAWVVLWASVQPWGGAFEAVTFSVDLWELWSVTPSKALVVSDAEQGFEAFYSGFLLAARIWSAVRAI